MIDVERSTDFGFYCVCGAAMEGRVKPVSEVVELEAIFDRVHHGRTNDPRDRSRGASPKAAMTQARQRRCTCTLTPAILAIEAEAASSRSLASSPATTDSEETA